MDIKRTTLARGSHQKPPPPKKNKNKKQKTKTKTKKKHQKTTQWCVSKCNDLLHSYHGTISQPLVSNIHEETRSDPFQTISSDCEGMELLLEMF